MCVSVCMVIVHKQSPRATFRAYTFSKVPCALSNRITFVYLLFLRFFFIIIFVFFFFVFVSYRYSSRKASFDRLQTKHKTFNIVNWIKKKYIRGTMGHKMTISSKRCNRANLNKRAEWNKRQFLLRFLFHFSVLSILTIFGRGGQLAQLNARNEMDEKRLTGSNGGGGSGAAPSYGNYQIWARNDRRETINTLQFSEKRLFICIFKNSFIFIKIAINFLINGRYIRRTFTFSRIKASAFFFSIGKIEICLRSF